MKKIAVTGTHGVGKTTLTHQLCVALKEDNFNAAIVEEKARYCPFPINEAATIDTELWMIHTQIRAELHVKAGKFEVAVMDRCSLDPIVYWHDRNTPHPYYDKLKEAALEWAQSEYDLLILVEPSSDTDNFAVDAVRDSGIVYRNRIRDLFKEYIESLPYSCHEKLICIEANSIFTKNGAHSEAVDRIILHPCYPSKESSLACKP